MMATRGAVDSIPRLLEAMRQFCAEHTHFESSAASARVLDELAAAADANCAALVPLRHKIFDFDAALRWGFFLEMVLPQFRLPGDAFDAAAYHRSLSTVYDLAVQTAVWDHLPDGSVTASMPGSTTASMSESSEDGG